MSEETIQILLKLLALGVQEAKRLSETTGKTVADILAESDLNWEEAGAEADRLLKLGHDK